MGLQGYKPRRCVELLLGPLQWAAYLKPLSQFYAKRATGSQTNMFGPSKFLENTMRGTEIYDKVLFKISKRNH